MFLPKPRLPNPFLRDSSTRKQSASFPRKVRKPTLAPMAVASDVDERISEADRDARLASVITVIDQSTRLIRLTFLGILDQVPLWWLINLKMKVYLALMNQMTLI